MVGGSWRILERLAKALGHSVAVAGTGPRTAESERFVHYTLPWFDYEVYGVGISVHLWGLMLYGLPLIPLTIAATLRERPKLAIANGFYSGLIALLIRQWFSVPYVVSLQQKLPEGPSFVRRVIRYVGQEGDGIFVNSEGNRSLISEVVGPGKVQVLPLWADDAYFRILDREVLRAKWRLAGRFVVLYVGRVDAEKNVNELLQTSEVLAADDRFVFMLAGAGNLAQALEEMSRKRKGIRYLGRVNDLRTLAELYQVADVVWSHADETYLSLPAIEALASGTPILVAERPAVVAHREPLHKVDPILVPPDVGWLIEVSDSRAVANLLTRLQEEGIPNGMRGRCRALAVQRYSSRNNQGLKAVLERLLARAGGA